MSIPVKRLYPDNGSEFINASSYVGWKRYDTEEELRVRVRLRAITIRHNL